MTEKLPLKPFFMIRHGQTVANAERYTAGSLDTPLTDLGRKQAKAASLLLKDFRHAIDIVAHSHLSRAKDTAMILNKSLDLPLTEISSIAERNYGDWTKKSWDDVKAKLQGDDIPPNGESRAEFTFRAIHGLSTILSRFKCPLIVTHGGVFDALAEHHGYRMKDVKNCVLYHFAPSNGDSTFPWNIFRISGTKETRPDQICVNEMLTPS